jgi:type II secretory pathway pseudopilin PulG
VTLVELLVVIAILAILLAVAVPLVRPFLGNRQISESARLVNAYFIGAQARAADLQRPVGVWIERRGNNAQNGAGESFELFYAESPPPYAGDTESARCWTTRDMMNNRVGLALFNQTAMDSTLLFSPPDPVMAPLTNFIRSGDLIRFNYRGPYYEIINIDKTMSTIQFRIPSGYPTVPLPVDANPMIGHPGYPYQVLRREIRSSAEPLQLPDNSTIDLTVSGLGQTGSQFAPPDPPGTTGPIVIMFSPTGSIESIRVHGSVSPPTGIVYLMIGLTEKVKPGTTMDPTPAFGADANLKDQDNRWISINHRTGRISTAKVSDSSSATDLPSAVQQARRLAINLE